MLAAEHFNVTLVTAGAELGAHRNLVGYLASLHVSIISLREEDFLACCNGALPSKISELESIREYYPELKLCVNVPLVDQEQQLEMLPGYLQLAHELTAKLKFIAAFELGRSRNRTPESTWVDRWSRLGNLLVSYGFELNEPGSREVEYANDEGVVVELSEIACAGVDAQYGGGRCFDNMDMTIDPGLNITLCRWQKNKFPLVLAERRELADVLCDAARADTRTCPYGISPHPLLAAEDHMARFIFDDHCGWPVECSDARESVLRLLDRREYSYLGKSGVAASFEREFAKYHEARHSLAVSSGTAALYLAYLALGLADGAEVILPIYSYPATLTPLLLLRAKVVFCDVDPWTGNISVASLQNAVSSTTRAVVVTHMWGDPADMDTVLRICRPRDIAVIEDCSHAIGAEIDGRKVGTFGDIGCFSLQANKSVSAGEGGALVTNRQDLFEAASIHGALKERILDTVYDVRNRRYWETGLGLKLKIHPFGAALALAYLKRLDTVNRARTERAELLNRLLSGVPGILPPRNGQPSVKRVYYTYKPMLGDELTQYRDWILHTMVREGLRPHQSDLRPLHRTYVYTANHGMPTEWLFPSLESRNGSREARDSNFVGAESYFQRIISFPTFTAEPFELVRMYAEKLTSAVELIRRGAKHSKKNLVGPAASV